jgi:hypothetical protein
MQNLGAAKKPVKLKPGALIFIGLIFIGLLYFGFRQFGVWNMITGNSTDTAQTQTQGGTNPSAVSEQPISLPSTNSAAVKPVSVTPPADPINPKRRGVAMLGKSGTFEYVVDTDGNTSKLISRDLKKEMIKEGLVTPEDIKNTLAIYIQDMYKQGVKGDGNIQFIVASSALADDKDGKIKNLAKALEKYAVVNYTTTEQEGRYAAMVAIPPQYRSSSFLIDVTPAFTRLTWFEGGATKTVKLAGSAYYKETTTDEQVKADTARLVAQIPQQNRRYGYIIWAAVEDKTSSDRYVALQDSYDIQDQNFESGMNIIQTVKQTTGAEMFFDRKSAFPMGFLGAK